MKRKVYINFKKFYINGDKFSIYIRWNGQDFKFEGENYWNSFMLDLYRHKLNTKK